MFCDQSGGQTAVLALNVADRAVSTVVSGLHGLVGEPVYSVDGRMLIVSSQSADGRGQISRIDLATRQISPVVQSTMSDTGPSVGPGGDTLAFVRSTRIRSRSMGGSTWCDADVWIGALSRGVYRQLTRQKAEAASPPQFSRDGKRLYVAFHSIMESDIYAVDVDSGATKKITTFGSYTTDPAVSPDGTCVVFVSDHLNPRDYGNTPLWRMRPDGTGAQPIRAPVRRWRGPRFFPDGRSVVCWVDDQGRGALWRIYLSGTGHRRLY